MIYTFSIFVLGHSTIHQESCGFLYTQYLTYGIWLPDYLPNFLSLLMTISMISNDFLNGSFFYILENLLDAQFLKQGFNRLFDEDGSLLWMFTSQELISLTIFP